MDEDIVHDIEHILPVICIIHTSVYIYDSVLDCHFVLVSNDCKFFLYSLEVNCCVFFIRRKRKDCGISTDH